MYAHGMKFLKSWEWVQRHICRQRTAITHFFQLSFCWCNRTAAWPAGSAALFISSCSASLRGIRAILFNDEDSYAFQWFTNIVATFTFSGFRASKPLQAYTGVSDNGRRGTHGITCCSSRGPTKIFIQSKPVYMHAMPALLSCTQKSEIR